MNIEQRLDRLEKQNRNLRRGLVGLLLLLLVVPLAAFVWQDKKPKVTKFDTIEAKTVLAGKVLVRKSADSKALIRLIAEDHEAAVGIIVGDQEKQTATTAMLLVKGPTKESPGTLSELNLDGGKNGSVEVEVTDRGQRVSLLDGSEQRRVALFHSPKKAGLHVENGVRRCQLLADKDQSNLVFMDKKDNVRLVVGFSDNGTGGVKMFDATYQPTVALKTDEKGSGLVLYHGKHKGVMLASAGGERFLAFNDGAGMPRFLLRHIPKDTKLGFFNGDPAEPRVVLGIQYDDDGRTRHDLWDKDGKPLKWDK